MKISVASGGFDPIHSGHIAFLNAASNYGDMLIVALNSDKWLSNKKGQPFMNFSERKIILENFSCVDEVMDFEDDELEIGNTFFIDGVLQSDEVPENVVEIHDLPSRFSADNFGRFIVSYNYFGRHDPNFAEGP